MSFFIGVDIGASTVKLGLYSKKTGVVGTRRDYPSRAGEGPEATMSVVKEAAAAILAENGIERSALTAAGACCPTPVSRDGMCVYPTNIGASWRGVNVRDLLSETLSVSSVLLNDGDAAAYREYAVRQAAGKASDGMAQFITGTGLGGALIFNGKIFQAPGVSAELGHLLTDSSDSADGCGCGATGCAETRCSLIGLANLVRQTQQGSDVPEVLLGEPRTVAKQLRRLGQAEEPLLPVRRIWDTYFTHLGRAARTVANTVGCDLVVISGGAQEREDGVSDRAYQRFLDRGIECVQTELRCSFPHLADVSVQWSIDTLADSACYGAAAYVEAQLGDRAKD